MKNFFCDIQIRSDSLMASLTNIEFLQWQYVKNHLPKWHNGISPNQSSDQQARTPGCCREQNMASGGVIDIAHGECTCYRSVRLSESSRNVLPMCYPSAFLFSWLLHHGLRIIAQPLHHTKCRAHLHCRTWNCVETRQMCRFAASICFVCESNSNKK